MKLQRPPRHHSEREQRRAVEPRSHTSTLPKKEMYEALPRAPRGDDAALVAHCPRGRRAAA